MSYEELNLFSNTSFGKKKKSKKKKKSSSSSKSTAAAKGMGDKAPGGFYAGGMGTVGDVMQHHPGASLTDAMDMAANPNATPIYSDPGADAYSGRAGGDPDGR